MSNFDDLWQGFIIMLTLCVVGIILAIFGGYILDHVFLYLDRGGFLDVPPNWQTMGNTYVIINIYYLVVACFPIVGIYMFVKCIIRRTGSDNYIAQ